ncbi:MAG: hypothetical protein CM1200mP39_06460 [Dehalococcoidia bacterium]|nr:MAG: hypothetical protein CM1200mP39_06460 [Dehalococcoidia bacterium]
MSAEVGTTAPDFTLFDTDGNEFSLSSLKREKRLFLHSFQQCSGCMRRRDVYFSQTPYLTIPR